MPIRHPLYALVLCVCIMLASSGRRVEAASEYVVRPGDTLWAIARHLDLSVERLAVVNHLAMTSTLHPGQRLAVPGTRSAVPARAAAPGEPATETGRAVAARTPLSLEAAVPGRVYTPVRTSLPSRGIAFTSRVVRTASRFLGRPYQWAGIGRRGFDCSGLVSRVFAAMGLVLPHSSFAQFQTGVSVLRQALAPGDLVFFRTYSPGPSHVGIYLGADRFIHASYSRGVIISSLLEPYYRHRYLGARRL